MPLNSRIFEIPRRLLHKKNGFSLDIGSTLIKVVYLSEKDEKLKQDGNVTLCMESFNVDQFDEALDLIKKKVTLTPGGTYQMSGIGVTLQKNLIEEKLNIKVTVVGEFKAFVRAFQFMNRNFPEDVYTLPSDPPHMEGIETFYENTKLVNKTGNAIPVSWDDCGGLSEATMIFILGTVGTLIKINPDGTHSIVNLNYCAAQALTGVGTLMCGAKNYEELMALASSGDFSKVHVCLPDLMDSYTESNKDKPGKDAIVFQYGKVGKGCDFTKEDLAAAVLRSQVDHLVNYSYLTCNLHKVQKIYLCGGMVEGSEFLRNEFKKSWEIHTHLGFYRPVEMKLLKHSGYLGAIGVLVKEDRTDDYEDFVQNVKANWDS